MNIFGDMTTLALLGLAVFILLRLRSVLGQRTGHQPPPPSRSARSAQERDKVIPLPGADSRAEAEEALARGEREREKAQHEAIDRMAPADSELNAQLKALAKIDSGFDPYAFLEGAKQAYEIIVTGFCEGDWKSMKPLVSREVLESFRSAAARSESRGEEAQAEQERLSLVGIESAEILRAEAKGKEGRISIRFASQMISSAREGDGDGSAEIREQVVEARDLWTFSRNLRSGDPNWKLIATESGE